jgi:hypothetical protein
MVSPGVRTDNRDVLINTSPEFLFWGTVYVIMKWTVGLWAVRRVVRWARTGS